MWCHSLGLQGTGRDLTVPKADHSSGHLQVVALVVANGSRSPVPVRVAVPHALNSSLDEGLALLSQVLEQPLGREIVVPAYLVPVLDAINGVNGGLEGEADGLTVLRSANLRAGGLRHGASLDASGEGDSDNWEETHIDDWKR